MTNFNEDFPTRYSNLKFSKYNTCFFQQQFSTYYKPETQMGSVPLRYRFVVGLKKIICVNLFLICVSRILSGISTQLFRNVFWVPLWYKWLLGYRMWLFKENYFRIPQKWKDDRIPFSANQLHWGIFTRKFRFFQ